MKELIQELQVIGSGPGGLGVAVGADNIGKLGDLLEDGVTFVDRNRPGGGALREFLDVKSNSSASDFYEQISTENLLAGVFDQKNAESLAAYGSDQVPLEKVGKFLDDVGRQIEELAAESPRSQVRPYTEIAEVRMIEDDAAGDITYRSIDRNGGQVADSRSVVIATGGREIALDLDKHAQKLLFSKDVLSGVVLEEIAHRRRQRPDGKVIIIGNSHTGLLVAHNLLHEFSDTQSHGIVVLGRHTVEPFFNSEAEALEYGFTFPKEKICPITGRPNRFGGPRGLARDVLISVLRGDEDRIDLQEYTGSLSKLTLLDESDIIIQATGYSANTPIITDQYDQVIGPQLDEKGRVKIDEQARPLDAHEMPISGIYYNGLGTDRRPPKSIGGEKAFNGAIDGVNVYQSVGKDIVEHILFLKGGENHG